MSSKICSRRFSNVHADSAKHVVSKNNHAKEGCTRACGCSSSVIACAGECGSCQGDIKDLSAQNVDIKSVRTD